MSSPPADAANRRPTYRIRKLRREGATPKGYRYTLEVADEHSGEKLAAGDVIGSGATELLIDTAARTRWKLTPNRALLPTYFSLSDETGRVEVQFDLQVARKLLVPLSRVALVLRDAAGAESLRLADARSSLAERLLGGSSGDWALQRGEESVALLTRLASRETKARGIRAWVLAALTPSDRGLVSFGDQHVLSAPAALSIVRLFNDLSDAPN